MDNLFMALLCNSEINMPLLGSLEHYIVHDCTEEQMIGNGGLITSCWLTFM